MEEPNSASGTNEQKSRNDEATELENDCLVAIGLNYEKDDSITLQFLIPPDEAREPSEEALSSPSSQSDHLESLTLEALVQEELQQQQDDDEEEFMEPIEGVSELSTPLMTSPREVQESCSRQEQEIAKRNPLYSKDGQNTNSTPSLTEILSQPKTNEEMKQIVEEVLRQYEIDSFQHLEVFDGIKTVLKKLKDEKQQLLRIHHQLNIKCNPVLESLPRMKVLIQQEQTLKKLVFAKEILNQIRDTSKNRTPLQPLKISQETGFQHCSFSKSKIPDWMFHNREFGQKILQRPLPSPSQKQDFENFVLEVDIHKKSETGNCKVKWVSKQTIIDKLEAKKKQEQKKQEQKKLEQKEKEERANMESKPEPQIPPKTQDLPKPVVKTEPISEVKTSIEAPLVLSLDSLGIGSETKQESTGFFSTVKPLETPKTNPSEAPESQPTGLLTPQSHPVMTTGPIEKPKEEIMSAEPTTGNSAFQASALFKNLGAFSNNQSNSSLTGVAAFGANSFPRPSVPSFSMNLVAPSLGSLSQSNQEGSMSNQGGFAGITGGFSVLSRQTQDIQINQTQSSFGGGFSQFSQQSNAFQQQSFQQQSQSNASNSTSSVFGMKPSPQNKGLWQMRK